MGNSKKAKRTRRKPGARRYADDSQEMLNRCNKNHEKVIGRPTKMLPEEEAHIANVINVAAEFGCPLSLLDLRIVVGT